MINNINNSITNRTVNGVEVLPFQKKKTAKVVLTLGMQMAFVARYKLAIMTFLKLEMVTLCLLQPFFRRQGTA